MTLYTVQPQGVSVAIEVYGGITGIDDRLLSSSSAGAIAYQALDPGSDARARLLIDCTHYLERKRWKGTRNAAGGTTLAFPRDDLTDENGDAATDAYQLARVVDAVAALIAAAAEDRSVLDQTDQGSNIKSMGAGSAKLEFFSGTSAARGTATAMPTAAQDLIGQWLAGSGSGAPVSVGGFSTGSCGNSSFDRCDGYEREKAF